MKARRLELRVTRHDRAKEVGEKTVFSVWYDVIVNDGRHEYATGWKEQRQEAVSDYISQQVNAGQDVEREVAELAMHLGMPSPSAYAASYSAASEEQRATWAEPEHQAKCYAAVEKALGVAPKFKRALTPPPVPATAERLDEIASGYSA